ncbi:MAG: dipeptide epimerase [Pseudomonadota bacterium]
MAADAPQLEARVTSWPMKAPFVIHGYRWEQMDVVTVHLTRGIETGRGEGAPLFYEHQEADALCAQLQALTPDEITLFEADRAALEHLLTGARNALDAAFIDLAAKESGRTAFEMLGLDAPAALNGLATVILASPEDMAAQALALKDIPILKLKLGGDKDLAAARAVRSARPDATLVTDVNCGWTVSQLEAALPVLNQLGFAMIEQPLAPKDDAVLKGLNSPIPLCADESCRTLSDIAAVSDRYDMINIKLDKCGGLTAALEMATRAKEMGLDIMIGNMLGSSLAMAPAFLLAQQAMYADLDGPLYLMQDCANGLQFSSGLVFPPEPQLWG